jgi:histidinol phosphatase-like enzyme
MTKVEVKNKMNMNSVPFTPMGGVGRGPFDEQARQSLEQYSQTFGKYLAHKEDKDFSDREKQKRDRAKKANKIYKQVCEDVGLKSCFFSNFGDWAEYVDGKMSDADFQSNAFVRARQMKAEDN